MLRIRDVYPGFRFLSIRIPDLESRIQKQHQKREVKKISYPTFVVATNITKFKIDLVLKTDEEKLWASLQRIIELYTQKIVNNLSKI